jgi:hypothetical protein
MALSILTDSEKKAFADMSMTTRTKFEAVLKKSGLPELTAQIKAELAELRKQNDKIHEDTNDIRSGFSALWSGVGQAWAERKSKKK